MASTRTHLDIKQPVKYSYLKGDTFRATTSSMISAQSVALPGGKTVYKQGEGTNDDSETKEVFEKMQESVRVQHSNGGGMVTKNRLLDRKGQEDSLETEPQ
mmetsp:Transcript_61660/g.70718  ORF Transcript_61660/g.70718 Transcript_61660/m.70718 type:complete len:101 (-) Transcript_61660:66-368(-)